MVIFGGAGKLAQGLIALQARQAGLDVHLVVRSPRRGHDSQEVIKVLQRRRETSIRLRTATVAVPIQGLYFSDREPDRTHLEDFLCAEPVVLICSAARAGQDDLASLLDSVLLRRRTPGLLALCPCENDLRPSLEAVGTKMSKRSGFAYLPAMVDRICVDIAVSAGKVVCSAEEDFEWVVAILSGASKTGRNVKPPMLALLSGLEAMGIHVRDLDQLRLIQHRKRLLMNGVQTSLSFLALQQRFDDLGAYLQTDRGRDALPSLMREYGVHLLHLDRTLSAENLRHYQAWYADRILQAADTVERVLGRLGNRTASNTLRVALKRVAETYDALLFIEGENAARETFVAQALSAATRAADPLD